MAPRGERTPRRRGRARALSLRQGTDDILVALAERWARATDVVVLTGAGLSTASGIPDFRSPGGRWSSYQPVPFPAFLSSEQAREEYWRYKGETWRLIDAALPNPAHTSLAELAHADRISLLVTQNVDGLHARSGFPENRLIEIHGTDSKVACVGCGARAERGVAQAAWESGERVPRCPCGSPWKPATISFGQSLVSRDLERALSSAASCELFLAVGTSLLVSPVNGMMELAARGGATTAILTSSDTPFDRLADFRVLRPVEQVLPELRDRIIAATQRDSPTR